MYFNKQIILVNNEASCYFIQFNDKFEYIYIYIYIYISNTKYMFR